MANDLVNRAFAALSDPTRRAIVERLTSGPATVTELAEPFDMALPTVSKHLKVLQQAHLIGRTVEGRRHWIRLNPEGLQEVTGWLDFHRRFWSSGIDRIDAALRTVPEKEKRGDRK